MQNQFKIIEHIGDLSAPNNGWTKELNLVSWNDRESVYDIRTWTADHIQYGKGVTLTVHEVQLLKDLI